MTADRSTRRRYLRRAAAVLGVAGSCALAGCPSPNQTVFDDVGDGDDNSDGGGVENPPPITREPDYEDWFDDVDNYTSGTVVYRADRESVPVSVGAAGNGGDRAFQRAAIAVSLGTTVAWEWTGDGAAHNVVSVDDAFDSGSPVAERSEPFRHQFTETGTFRYLCERHEAAGMKGAVTVYDPDD